MFDFQLIPLDRITIIVGNNHKQLNTALAYRLFLCKLTYLFHSVR